MISDTQAPYWMLIFLLVAGHGIFLSSYLSLRGSKLAGARSLAWLMLLFALSLIYYVAYWTGNLSGVSRFWGLILTFPTLYGPLLYQFYGRQQGIKVHALHFLPFCLHFAYASAYFLQKTGFILWPLFSGQGMMAFTVFQNLSLAVYSTLLIVRSLKTRRKTLHMMGWSFLGFSLSFISYYVLVFTIDFTPAHDYAVSFTMSIFMFTIGYLSFRGGNFSKKAMYEKSGLTPQVAEEYKIKLLQLMEEKRPYRNGNLKQRDLADMLDMSVHHLSEVINRQLGINFSEFLNQYRVEEARKLLLTNHGIIDIGYRVGFNNRTSFSQTFKKHTGLSPSGYRRQHRQLLKNSA